MAIVNIVEYAKVVSDSFGRWVQAGEEPALGIQDVAFTGVSAQSVTFHAQTQIVRLHCDEACRVLFGPDPTATATSIRMAANQTEYFGIPIGLGYKVAVISA